MKLPPIRASCVAKEQWARLMLMHFGALQISLAYTKYVAYVTAHKLRVAFHITAAPNLLHCTPPMLFGS